MLKNIEFFFFLLRTSIRASISLRGAFLLESILMISTNLIFILLWWIFFRQFKEIAGWTLRDMVALNAVGMGAYGLFLICSGGIKRLSRIILNGDLDPFMTQPKSLLLHLMGARSFSKGWGHLMTSALLLFLGNLTSPLTLLSVLIGILCGWSVFTAMTIIAHSLSFWLGAIENVSKKYCDSLFLFTLYPPHIYSGILYWIMFTLIPAGIIAYLPVTLIRDFAWKSLLLLIGSSILFLAAAFAFFYKGLRRYESGNRFGAAL